MANPLLYVAILGPVFAVYVPIVRGLVAEYRRLFPVSRARSPRAVGAAVRWGDRTTPNAPVADTGSTGRHRVPRTSRRDMPPAGTWRVSVPAGGPRRGRPQW